MISLPLFFNGLTHQQKQAWQNPYTLGGDIRFHSGELFPDIDGTAIALIGVAQTEDFTSVNAVRKQLYTLAPLSRRINIADWGNLRPIDDRENIYARLREVCEYCLTENILPVIIGDRHDNAFGQFWSYETSGKIITIVSIDSTIDLRIQDDSNLSDNHVHHILSHYPNYLLEYAHLGYQRHLTNPTIVQTLQHLNLELRSIGQMRDSLHDIEPTIRAADMLSFDLSALRSDTYVSDRSTPFGFTNDEACQICWYAGMSEMLTSIGFYGYSSAHDKEMIGAKTLAAMIWYFWEGFVFRREVHSFKSNFYVRYIVPIPNANIEITFYKSKITDKWWLEVFPDTNNTLLYERKKVVPCSYQDYETACQGKIPERWLKALDKI